MLEDAALAWFSVLFSSFLPSTAIADAIYADFHVGQSQYQIDAYIGRDDEEMTARCKAWYFADEEVSGESAIQLEDLAIQTRQACVR